MYLRNICLLWFCKQSFPLAVVLSQTNLSLFEYWQALRELNGQDLLGRPVKLDLARERGAYTPYDCVSLFCIPWTCNLCWCKLLIVINFSSGQETQSFQKGGRPPQGQTVFVRGFDPNDGEEQVRIQCFTFTLYLCYHLYCQLLRGMNSLSQYKLQIRSSLEGHFGTCGEISRVSIPKGPDGGFKGCDFSSF